MSLMNRFASHGSVLIMALLCLPASSNKSFGQYRPTVGQPHADFLLPRIDNREPVSLSQFRGKKVLLIHFASW